MEILLKVLGWVVLIIIFWKVIPWLLKHALENAKSRIISFFGGILVVLIFGSFILLIRWLLNI